MMWLWVLLLVVVVGAIAVLAAGRDDAMVEVYDDRPDALLPAGRLLTADDLAAVRLSTAVRGYRMDEVDALLARVQVDLQAREAQEVALPADAGPEQEHVERDELAPGEERAQVRRPESPQL